MEIAMRPVVGAFVLLWLAVASVASAQTGQGRLTGTVTDGQHAVLPGVTVGATSPALIGEHTAITQSDGRYLFPALPSGVYSLTFTLSHFHILVREGIGLSLATTITVDSQLSLADLQESVVVTAATPVVDVATTKVGVNLKGDPLVGVPNSTDIWGVLSHFGLEYTPPVQRMWSGKSMCWTSITRCPVCAQELWIDNADQRWMCKTCRSGGDVIHLVQHATACTAQRAIAWLSGDAPMPDHQSKSARQHALSKNRRLEDIAQRYGLMLTETTERPEAPAYWCGTGWLRGGKTFITTSFGLVTVLDGGVGKSSPLHDFVYVDPDRDVLSRERFTRFQSAPVPS